MLDYLVQYISMFLCAVLVQVIKGYFDFVCKEIGFVSILLVYSTVNGTLVCAVFPFKTKCLLE